MLTHILREDNYKKTIPIADSLQEAVGYIKKLYDTAEGICTAYYFKSN